MQRAVVLALLAAVLALGSCTASAPKQRGAGVADVLRPESYVRIVSPDSNIVQLQIAVRKFVPARGNGPAVWLTGVSHVGESNYFAALQEHLDEQTLVLYEGVGEAPTSPRGAALQTSPSLGVAAPEAPPMVESATRQANRSSLQTAMAASLGLAFQLEAIDYSRPQFHNSDLSVAELREVIAQKGATSKTDEAAHSFESLLQIMQGGTVWDWLIKMGLSVVGASPKLQGLSKLALMETLGDIQGDPSQLRGLPPELQELLEVLVQRRNQKVLTDLRANLKRMGQQDSVSIFYGTGHMPDLEVRLRQELKYRPEDQIWLTAFSVNLARAGISSGERDFIQGFVKRELEELRQH